LVRIAPAGVPEADVFGWGIFWMVGRALMACWIIGYSIVTSNLLKKPYTGKGAGKVTRRHRSFRLGCGAVALLCRAIALGRYAS